MFYKWLNKEGCGPYSNWAWPLPTKRDNGAWEPGAWTPPVSNLVKCEYGYHLCDCTQLSRWCQATLWLAEGRGEHITDEEKHLFAEARLLAPVEMWNERTARLFACDCAERVVHLANDERSMNAIAVARHFANGEATQEELAAAWAAAWDAAWAAARDAAWDAAWDAEHLWQSARLCELLGLEDK